MRGVRGDDTDGYPKWQERRAPALRLLDSPIMNGGPPVDSVRLLNYRCARARRVRKPEDGPSLCLLRFDTDQDQWHSRHASSLPYDVIELAFVVGDA